MGSHHLGETQFKIESERGAQSRSMISSDGRARAGGMTLYLPHVTYPPGEDGDELRD
jgi:hypothetical protein